VFEGVRVVRYQDTWIYRNIGLLNLVSGTK
jgi:hypothetical protein